MVAVCSLHMVFRHEVSRILKVKASLLEQVPQAIFYGGWLVCNVMLELVCNVRLQYRVSVCLPAYIIIQ